MLLNCLRQHLGFYCVANSHVKKNCTRHNSLRLSRSSQNVARMQPLLNIPFIFNFFQSNTLYFNIRYVITGNACIRDDHNWNWTIHGTFVFNSLNNCVFMIVIVVNHIFLNFVWKIYIFDFYLQLHQCNVVIESDVHHHVL